jgi:hypothetical protein
LDGFGKYVDEKYMPVADDPQEFCDKFHKIERAVKRFEKEKAELKTSDVPENKEEPKQILEKYLGQNTYLEMFYRQYYQDAWEAVKDKGNPAELALNMGELYQWIKKNQSEKAKKNREVPGAGSIIAQYIYHISNQGWLQEKTPKLFTKNHKLFQKFLASLSNDVQADVITGKYFA